MQVFRVNTCEFLAATLRRGNAAATPPLVTSRFSTPRSRSFLIITGTAPPILIRADTVGCTREFLTPHPRPARSGGELRVLGRLGHHREGSAAITAILKKVWADAIDADGGHGDGAGVAEITGVLPARSLVGYPFGRRVIVRRKPTHPGAQLDPVETDGSRHNAFATATRVGQLAHLDARHRAHARVEDRIRIG